MTANTTTNHRFDLYKTLSQLDDIKEFSSKYSINHCKYIFDNVSVDDPFNRETILKRIDPKDKAAKDALNKLIIRFEQSLDRVLNFQSMNRNNALESYRKLLQENIDVIFKTSSLKSAPAVTTNTEQNSATTLSIKKLLFEVSEGEKSQVETTVKPEVQIKRRKQLSREAKRFLETAFEAKRDPNSKERQLIAERSGLTPMQVRVWFTNKRMRSK